MRLITDRTQADVDAVKALRKKRLSDMTEAERDSWLAGMKGAYNALDFNRVQEAMEEIAEMLTERGYATSVKRPTITETVDSNGEILPDGYVSLDYIESTGTQYIDSLFKPNQDSKVIADVEFLSPPITYPVPFGVRTSASAQFWLYANSETTTAAPWRALLGSQQTTDFKNASGRQVIELGQAKFVVNGEPFSFAQETFQCTHSLFLFAHNKEGSNVEFLTKAKYFSCQMYSGDTLARDFRPAMQLDTFEAGLYDLVEGKFYGNAGTGYFIPGTVSFLPDGYTKLSCIKSSGTQHIDTDFKHNQNTRVCLSAQQTSVDNSSQWVFGGRSSSNSATMGVFWLNSDSAWNADYNGSSQRYAFSGIGSTDLLSVDYNKNVLSVNGKSKTFTAETFQSTATLVLLGLNANGTVSGQSCASLSACAIYDNDALVRLYTPCMSPDGAVGLYDSVTDAFFGNAGTGEFAAGNVVATLPTERTETRDYWMPGDIPDAANRALYLQNVQTIRDAFAVFNTTPNTPSDMESFTYQQANAIEKILLDVSLLIMAFDNAVLYGGEVYCGEV